MSVYIFAEEKTLTKRLVQILGKQKNMQVSFKNIILNKALFKK